MVYIILQKNEHHQMLKHTVFKTWQANTFSIKA
jgi:hypothetical protein